MIIGRNIFLILFLLYVLSFNSIYSGFIQEDWLLIKNYTFSEILTIFYSSWSEIYRQEYFRPLVIVSYAVDYKIFGLNFIGHHISHLVYYSIMLVLLYLSILKFSKNNIIAFLTTFIFLINPISAYHSEVLTQRTDVLGLLFAIMSFYMFLFYRDSDKNSKAYLMLTVLLYLLALLSKETYLIYVGLIFFMMLNDKKRYEKKYLKYFFSILIVSILYLVYWTILDLGSSNHSPMLGSYISAILNIYFSNEAITQIDSLIVQIVIFISIASVFIFGRYKFFTSKIMLIIFILSIIFFLSERIRLLTIPGIVFSYYLAVNVYLLSKHIQKNKKIKYLMLNLLIIVVSYFFITFHYKKDLGIGSEYYKYANIVFYQNKNIIPEENRNKYDELIESFGLSENEQVQYVSDWLQKNENKFKKNKYLKYISLFLFVMIVGRYIRYIVIVLRRLVLKIINIKYYK
ncbi:hypothetical protein [Aliarcobacter cryaerophilus]|uniref:hypothetical protein n=1 Tax=Aliarcobacter cryaerophilus TaxID=28198 RepID=UPI003DA27920